MKYHKQTKKPNFDPKEEIHNKTIRKVSDLTARLHHYNPEYTQLEYEDFLRIFVNFLAKELACSNRVVLPGICSFRVTKQKAKYSPLRGGIEIPETLRLSIRGSVELKKLLKEIWKANLPLEAVTNPIDKPALRRKKVQIKTTELV